MSLLWWKILTNTECQSSGTHWMPERLLGTVSHTITEELKEVLFLLCVLCPWSWALFTQQTHTLPCSCIELHLLGVKQQSQVIALKDLHCSPSQTPSAGSTTSQCLHTGICKDSIPGLRLLWVFWFWFEMVHTKMAVGLAFYIHIFVVFRNGAKPRLQLIH